MNLTGISGYLTADPELKTTSSGLSVCSFTVAVKRPMSKDATDFIDCVAWRQSAEFLTKYFRKGSRIEVSGHLQSRTYGEEGNKRKVTELVAENIQFGSKKEENGEQKSNSENIESEFDEDYLPF